MGQPNRQTFVSRVLLVISLVGLVLVVAWFAWAVIDVLLLGGLGVLVAVMLRTLAAPIARRTPLSKKSALGVVVLVLVLVLAGLSWLLVPEIIAQASQLIEQVEIGIEQLEAIAVERLGEEGLYNVIEGLNGQRLSLNYWFPQVFDTLTLTLSILGDSLFVLFTGLFVAFDPYLYRRGIISLIPPQGRNRANDVINAIVQGLRAWLLGRVISMVVVGLVTSLGLGLLNIPLALVLGLIAALLEFIPVLGPVLAAVPGILIAFTLSPVKALYVALFYLVLQQLEGNILTPIVQQRVVSLPPALGLSAVLAMGIVFGILGVLVATPFTVMVLITVRMLYLNERLDDIL
ncbi:AI-2E family transporter [Nodosilinea sp. LEGE 06152]|uniref:AI-2E family transporter n=1 Tax=Nodosilinea sp. LEGE 06152 TaxID=2777966 RepID=UPI00187F16F4|nr:AI-2E family transporter [Nodosilinea sp. LEGE 06152]MBE9158732.1 AI-2E family transporter [Nodosilinea sp. LEGE 06152]